MLAGMNNLFGEPEVDAPGGFGSANLGVGESMFNSIGKPPSFAPSPESMAKAMEDLQHNRKVQFKEFISRTYDLSIPAECEQYVVDMEHIMIGTTMRTHMLIDRPPKQFVSDAGGSRYIAYLEWVEFALVDTPTPIGASNG